MTLNREILQITEEAGYSNFYATKATYLPDDIRAEKGMQTDESEMMLASILIGNTIDMDRDSNAPMAAACRKLRTPPAIASCSPDKGEDDVDVCNTPPKQPAGIDNFKYNTVRGYTQTDKKISDEPADKGGTWTKNASCPRSKM